MRAVLFASATATTRLGRRWRSPITHGSALVAFERSKLAPTAEAARFYHRGGEGCGDDRADARNARQALADGVALVPGHELLLDRHNRRLQLLNLCRQHL